MSLLQGKKIVLGVTGGIAAYKAAALASLLVQQSASVDVIMTEAATAFIQPLTFTALTHRPVHTKALADWDHHASGHVTLAAGADLLLVAPATAASLARLALGLADDLLGLVALATTAPLLVAPAMEHHMWHHPATQEHVRVLLARGAVIVPPEPGRLASGASGDGRLASPETIVQAVVSLLQESSTLTGRHIVVTAGGTREPIDPVRYIGNRSSGQMGYAIAQAAVRAGAKVTLISGPVAITPPPGVTYLPVETAREMESAVHSAIPDADALIMAAAVSDYRVADASDHKIKKEAGAHTLDLHLVQNPDILAGIDQPGLVKIGFAAETDDLLDNAACKLASKGLAMLVANDAVATIGAPDSRAWLLFPGGRVDELPRMGKDQVARRIVSELGMLFAEFDQLAT
ncbi:MAG: bifunctional phosphopantothenoylcysteine decarboxylase/phosphopantothenate--cysteine ligase CoaBC [Thermomicrobiales bacterium]